MLKPELLQFAMVAVEHQQLLSKELKQYILGVISFKNNS
jgi:hypothetical protein